MSTLPVSARRPVLSLVIASAFFAGQGCTAVYVAGKAVTTTVGVAADVTSATVRGTGKVVASAVHASGDVADESVRTAAKLSKTGMIVFFDPKSGVVRETPWRQGLKLFAATESAKLDAALSAVRIIRAGRVISAAGQTGRTLQLASGDVVEVARS